MAPPRVSWAAGELRARGAPSFCPHCPGKPLSHQPGWVGSHGNVAAGAGVTECLGGTEKKLREPQSKGVVIVAVTVSLLVLALLGAILCFFYKKGKLPCGRSGKQEM